MGVTMQNHGGYGERYDNFNQEVYKVGASYTDANQYLSLLNESDKALEISSHTLRVWMTR